MRTIFLMMIVIFSACVSPEEIKKQTNKENDVRFEFFTTNRNNDEIQFTYYDNKAAIDVTEILVFEYDANGNPLPKIIKWDKFEYKFIRGNAFRNNFSPTELTINLYVNDELVYEETSIGTQTEFATVYFDHIIE